MGQLRRVIFWCHLAAGACAGVVILSMSVTGVLLAYERQLTRWADTREYRITRPSPDAHRLPVEALVARARETRKGAAPTAVTVYAGETEPTTVSFPGGRNLFVNPYTGEVLSEGSPRVRAFFRGVTDWHRWLGAGQQHGAALPLDGLDALLVRAGRQVEGWRTITLQLPQKADAPVTFAIDCGNGGQPQLRSQLTLDRATGEVVRREQYSNNTLGRRMRSWLRFAHTGEVYGLIGQTVAALASLGGALLVYTGLSLALRRLFAWLSSRRALDAARAEPSPGD